MPDVYVEVPYALHGFNMAHSPLSFALADAVVRFLRAVAAAHGGKHEGNATTMIRGAWSPHVENRPVLARL